MSSNMNVTFKKGKDSRSLVAVNGVAVRVHRVMLGHSICPYLSFRCLYSTLIRNRYPFTDVSTDRVFQPRDGIELATFSTVVQRCNPIDHRIVTCIPLSLPSGSRLTIILKLKVGLSLILVELFKVFTFTEKISIFFTNPPFLQKKKVHSLWQDDYWIKTSFLQLCTARTAWSEVRTVHSCNSW